jgi:hypothetical protein
MVLEYHKKDRETEGDHSRARARARASVGTVAAPNVCGTQIWSDLGLREMSITISQFHAAKRCRRGAPGPLGEFLTAKNTCKCWHVQSQLCWCKQLRDGAEMLLRQLKSTRGSNTVKRANEQQWLSPTQRGRARRGNAKLAVQLLQRKREHLGDNVCINKKKIRINKAAGTETCGAFIVVTGERKMA